MSKRLADSSSETYIREHFIGRALAKAQSTNMRISSRLIGFDVNLYPVRQYTNRSETMYAVIEPYAHVVTDTKPEMSTEWN